MKYFLLFSILILVSFAPFISSQAPETLWTKTFGGGSGRKVLETSDGGYIIAGGTRSYSGIDYDVFVVKTNHNGDTLWTRVFGGNEDEQALSIIQTPENDYVIVGYTYTFSTGYSDGLILKINSNGDSLWQNNFGNIYYDDFLSIQMTADNGFIIVGEAQPMAINDNEVWICKIDSTGALEWEKFYGGVNADQGFSVRGTSDSCFIVTGYTSSFGQNGDAWLLKIDNMGDTLWTKTIGGVENDIGWDIQPTSDNGYIIVGETKSFGKGDYDVFLVKTDSVGNINWMNTYGDSLEDRGSSIQETDDGGLVIAGRTASFGAGQWDLWLIKTDYLGNTLWTKTFGGIQNDQGFSVQQTIDRGYIITGETGGDVWLIKLGPDLPTDIKREADIVDNYYLQQNYPNPFNPSTLIKYEIPELSFVTLKVYDVLGNEIVTLVNKEKPVGSYETKFNAKGLPSGIYFYRLQAGSFVETKKMVLLR